MFIALSTILKDIPDAEFIALHNNLVKVRKTHHHNMTT